MVRDPEPSDCAMVSEILALCNKYQISVESTGLVGGTIQTR